MDIRVLKYCRITIVVALILAFPVTGFAGARDYLKGIVNWWNARSAHQSMQTNSNVETKSNISSGENSEGGTEEGSTRQSTPGMCNVPRARPEVKCELGSRPLCINTPAGGVAKGSIVIKGTIDRKSSVPASIRIVVQNEYTKKLTMINTDNPATHDCWAVDENGPPFCLSDDGYFSAVVPLVAKGPYSISMSVSRLTGSAVEETIRTSRVVPVVLDKDKITFDPDVRSISEIDANTVFVNSRFISSCRFCDFIGASTGGVMFQVENSIKDPNGAVRTIKCQTRIEQGGGGEFRVGVPVITGENNLKISACNAANGAECPSLGGITFKAKGDFEKIEIVTPPPMPTYNNYEYPTIPWVFKVGDGKRCVNVVFNRDASKEVCPVDGSYQIELNPQIGINVATIADKDGVEEFAWTFGWGKVISPFGAGNDQMAVKNGVTLAVPAGSLSLFVLPIVNNFLNSDEFGKYMDRIFNMPIPLDPSSNADGPKIPNCNSTGPQKFKITIKEKPQVGKAELKSVSTSDGKINLSLFFENLLISISATPDLNGNGEPDTDPLDIQIGFKRILIDASINVADGNMLLIGAPHDACSYRDGEDCGKLPAVVTPKNFTGAFEGGESFLKCNEDTASGLAYPLCLAINCLGGDSGMVGRMVLDAINSAAYCSGSAAITQSFATEIKPNDIIIGCGDSDTCSPAIRLLNTLQLPVSLNIKDNLSISPSGMILGARANVGNSRYFGATPSKLQIPSVGIIASGSNGSHTFKNPSDVKGDVGVALSMDIINSVIYAISAYGDGETKKGLLDIDIDETVLNSLNIDFVKQCDQFEPSTDPNAKTIDKELPTLCFVRPRVGELLGPMLTSFGYFDGRTKQPIQIAIRANRALGPRLSVATIDDLSIISDGKGNDAKTEDVPMGELLKLDIGGLKLSFYALEIDKNIPEDRFGNLAIKKDENGSPVIMSMRPDDLDPKNGQIVSLDVTMLVALEVWMAPAKEGDERDAIWIRTIPNRSRLVLTEIAGTNSTTVSSIGLSSYFADMLRYSVASIGRQDTAIAINLPEEFGMGGYGTDDLYSAIGLKKIAIGPRGIGVELDEEGNAISVMTDLIATQILHEAGKILERKIPPR